MTLLASWSSLPQVERTARLRSLAMAAKLLLGRQADPLVALLRLAETEDHGLELADVSIDKLPTIQKRRLLSCMAYLP